MIRTKGEAGSGNIVEAVRHMRTIQKEMKQLTVLGKEELMAEAKKHAAPFALIEYVAEHGKLPVPNFSAGGIATPADAALVMQLGAEAVFVGSGIFIPGGESTTMLKLLREENLMEPLRDFGSRRPIFGTCAGAILLANEVSSPAQESLGLIDIGVERNAYGRQIDSRVTSLTPET